MYPYINIGDLQLPVYGLMMVLGFSVAAAVSMIRGRSRGLPEEAMIIVMVCATAMAMIGLKLVYILSMPPDNIAAVIETEGFIALFVNAGLVFYGGVIGGAVGAFAGLRICKVECGGLFFQAMVPAIPLGHAIGRAGCFFSGCCYGIPHVGFASVAYVQPIGGAPIGVPLFPVQLLEALVCIVIFAVLTGFGKKLP